MTDVQLSRHLWWTADFRLRPVLIVQTIANPAVSRGRKLLRSDFLRINNPLSKLRLSDTDNTFQNNSVNIIPNLSALIYKTYIPFGFSRSSSGRRWRSYSRYSVLCQTVSINVYKHPNLLVSWLTERQAIHIIYCVCQALSAPAKFIVFCLWTEHPSLFPPLTDFQHLTFFVVSNTHYCHTV